MLKTCCCRGLKTRPPIRQFTHTNRYRAIHVFSGEDAMPQRLLMREEVPSLAYPEDERRTDDDDDPIDEA